MAHDSVWALGIYLSAMDIEERIEIRADLIYTGILDAVERLKNQSVDVFMEKACANSWSRL